MAKKTSVKNSANNLLIQTVDIKQINRGSIDITKWRNALKAAEGTSENRKLLYELYAEIVLDGHLKSVMEKRILSITNNDIMFVKDGKPVEEMYPLIYSKNFLKVLRYIVEAKLYGHSLIETYKESEKLVSKLVDRRHVKPRFGLVVKNSADTNGVLYKEPPYDSFVIEVGEPDDYGLLLQAAQYVIYKRGGFGDWADYIQLFGIPFRKATYKNPEHKTIVDQALDAMGSSGWMSSPEGVELEIVRAEGATGANLVFSNFKDACNTEISITILGQTMTTSDTENSGYAQGKIHQAVEAELHRDDKAFVMKHLNDADDGFLKVLQNLGYPVEGGEFVYIESENLTLKERIDIDTKVAQLVPIDTTYFYEKYGIPVPSTKETTGGQQNETPVKKEINDIKKENKLSTQSTHIDTHIQETDSDTWWRRLFSFFFQKQQLNDVAELSNMYQLADKPTGLVDDPYKRFIKGIEALLERIAKGDLKPSDLNADLFNFTATNLINASAEGVGIKADDYLKSDELMIKNLRENVYKFAGFKTHSNLVELNKLLLDDKGKLIPFNEFKKNVQAFREAAMKVVQKYNENWLYSEYQTAVLQSQHAANWKRFEKDKDIFPNLKYRTAKDDQVRHSHAKFDGVVKPINDKFWDTYSPQNDWGCRCYLEQTEEKATKEAISMFTVPDDFKNNTGKTGQIYNDKHPYFNTKEAKAINKSIEKLRK